ncbi:MAG: hypothetical protein R3A52_26670 [Polyangiales bacterium]
MSDARDDAPAPGAAPREGLRERSRRERLEKEAALGPEGRILLALRLGLRMKRLREAAGR